MYFVLYDRNLNSLGETYVLESWSRIQRSSDFDDLHITGEYIPYYVDPFFVVVNDRQGKLQFSGLASTPVIDDKNKKTSISLKDYMTLFNTDIVVSGTFDKIKAFSYLQHLLTLWLQQTDVGFSKITWDMSRISEIPWDSDFSIDPNPHSIFLYDSIQSFLSYYNVYCIPELNIPDKTLSFVFYPMSVHKVSIQLKDFGVLKVEKSFGDYNRVSVYDSAYRKYSEWALTVDNQIIKLPTANKELIYPAKARNFIAEPVSDTLTKEQSLFNAVYDAVMGLAQNRYQENIDLDIQKYPSAISDKSIDFSYSFLTYSDKGFYKELPVGEIETDSKGKYIVRLGQRVQDITQEI